VRSGLAGVLTAPLSCDRSHADMPHKRITSVVAALVSYSFICKFVFPEDRKRIKLRSAHHNAAEFVSLDISVFWSKRGDAKAFVTPPKNALNEILAEHGAQVEELLFICGLPFL